MPEKELLARISKMSRREKKELIKKIGQGAYDNEMTCMGCSQTTLAALQKNLGLEEPSVFRAASGLAGGVGRTGEGACGALVAGVMVVSLICGREKLEPASISNAYLEAMNRSGILCDRFVEHFGSLKCHDIQRKVTGRAWNLRDPEERNKLHDGALAECSNVCRKAAELAAEIILEPEA